MTDDDYVTVGVHVDGDCCALVVVQADGCGGAQETRFPIRRSELAELAVQATAAVGRLAVGRAPECPECGEHISYLEFSDPEDGT